MSRSCFLVALAVLLALLPLCAVPVLGQAPVAQASQADLPLLSEFTLQPTDLQFTYTFVPQVDGPHSLVAAWGAAVGLRLEVTGDSALPRLSQGNPAVVVFEAKRGVAYTVRIRPSATLPVTSVGQLFGGPKNAPPKEIPSGGSVPATPIPLPGPVTPQALALPLLSPQLPSSAVVAKLSGTVDLTKTLKAAGNVPALSATIMALPKSALEAAGRPGGDAPRVRAPSVPQSVNDLDWRAGIKLRFGVEPPAYYVNGKKYHVAHLRAFGASLPDTRFTDLQTKGIVELWPQWGGYCFVVAYLELPAEPATYAFTFRTTDYNGFLVSKWIDGDDPPIQIQCWPYWHPHNGKMGKPAMIMSLGSPGITTVLTASPSPDANAGGSPTMRRVNLVIGLYYPKDPDRDDFPEQRFLFGGLDIVRIN